MESSNERFLHIVEEIQNAVNDCFQYAARNNPNAFVLAITNTTSGRNGKNASNIGSTIPGIGPNAL